MTMVPWQEGGRTIERTAETRLDEAIRGALETLAKHKVEPDCFTHHTQQIPFGRFGEGHITNTLTVDEGFVSGGISFVSDSDPDQSFYVRKELGNPTWRDKNGRKFSDWGVARKLDANWPQQLVDNTAVRRLADPRDRHVTPDDLFVLIETMLAPNARYFTVKNVYAYSTVRIEQETNTYSYITFLLASEEDQDGFQQRFAQLTIPYICDKMPTYLHSRVAFNELDTLTVSSWYDHPEKGDPVAINRSTINNAWIYQEIIDNIEALVDEKTTVAKAA